MDDIAKGPVTEAAVDTVPEQCDNISPAERGWNDLSVKTRWLVAFTLLAVLGVSYKSSEWYASAGDYVQYHSEHYHVGDCECYKCFRGVAYWQVKGEEPRGAKTVCDNCGFMNTYLQDTASREKSWCEKSWWQFIPRIKSPGHARREFHRKYYHAGDSKCHNCSKKVRYWQKKGVKPQGMETVCKNCGFTNTYERPTA